MDVKTILAAHERMPHKQHQLEGVLELIADENIDRGRVVPNALFLGDEVGCAKTKQVIDASQILFWLQGKIDTVLVVAPGFARSTWAEEDPMLGEVAKHAWEAVPNVIHEYHGDYDEIEWVPNALNWIVTNFEFVRRENRLLSLLRQLRGRRTWLVIDESWAIKGRSDQTKACMKLRYKHAERCTLLNGTPLADGKPIDLYYQFQTLDNRILGVKNKAHFLSRYCIMGGADNRKIVEYQNLNELNAKVAPYVLARKTRDCWDLPPMLDPIIVEARLTDTTWKLYRQMRDEMVAWLGNQATVSRIAITRGLRLAQITSGYLGGLEDIDSDGCPPGLTEADVLFGPRPQFLRPADAPAPTLSTPSLGPATKEIGREKLDAFLHWIGIVKPVKLLTWCRFRPEMTRTHDELVPIYRRTAYLRGGQTPDERRHAKMLLAPGGDALPAAVVGNQKAGGASLNFSGANFMVFMSQGPALLERTQSIGRIERPGQTQPMQIVDIVATGPKGQRTIDHSILKSLKAKNDMSRWTVEQWRRIIAEE